LSEASSAVSDEMRTLCDVLSELSSAFAVERSTDCERLSLDSRAVSDEMSTELEVMPEARVAALATIADVAMEAPAEAAADADAESPVMTTIALWISDDASSEPSATSSRRWADELIAMCVP
jgi:hypothetical protein